MPGVVRTRVGYTGGTRKNPTYHSLGDHSESIQIDYDPSVITYRDLLRTFWQSHRATHEPWSRQYRSAVFFHDESQKEAAMEVMSEEEVRLQAQIYTALQPVDRFYWAEDYHQKYSLRHFREVYNEFLAMYPKLENFVNSTAVTRANGFVGGSGSFDLLQTEIDRYGLSRLARDKLLETAKLYNR